MDAKSFLLGAAAGALVLYSALSLAGKDAKYFYTLNRIENASFYADMTRDNAVTYGLCNVEGISITTEKWSLDAVVQVMLDETQESCQNPWPQTVEVWEARGLLDAGTGEPVGYELIFRPTYIGVNLDMENIMGFNSNGPAILDTLTLTTRKTLSVGYADAPVGTFYDVVEN
ncbi:TPA: hypothetical protein HA239_04805 [Candidatus Woesearchaeota archaeon]|nr:hypothetical protein QT06_C0001G0150 [archaeon GW2011_AR15]MBS3104048.1 hypothetical protein [Candidatus Woesearchaeota archaeon]HIH41704.1 hypothetical protein [Candidatus Woesearchaeota archaeon]